MIEELCFLLVRAEGLQAGQSLQIISIPCGGGVEYLLRSLARRRTRRKGNPVPGAITGPPCSWGI
jgi:hypothetical protein